MKILKKKIIWFCVVVLMSVMIMILNIFNGKSDSSITSFGFSLCIIGLLKLIQFARIARKDELMKRFEEQQNDERYIMLAEKSGRFAFLISVFAEFAAMVVLLLFGLSEISQVIAYVAAAQSIVYLLTYIYLSKKY